MTHKINIAILGASGYTGAELIRLGVPARLVHMRGYGATDPFSPPRGPAGMVDPAANRVAVWVCYADATICRDVRRSAP